MFKVGDRANTPLPNEIVNIPQVQQLAVLGFTDWKKYGEVSVRDNGKDLLIFNYTAKCAYDDRWNYFERICRGLIINRVTGEIVARGFDKFFNWFQGGRVSSGHIVTITEKVDGSLGILYRDNGYKISTRGSFDSDQAIWATQFLDEHHDLTGLPNELTLLFEIIYPGNRVVVDYHGSKNLVLLAARNRFTGDYLPYYPSIYDLVQQYGFAVTPTYTFNNITEIIEKTGTMGLETEGFVVEFSDGQRFKFKGDRYVELHRLISGLSFRHTLVAVASNTLESILSQIPDEFLDQVKGWQQEIEARVEGVSMAVRTVFALAPKENRKEFALWVNANHKDLAPYLFMLLDGKDITPKIYDLEFKNNADEKILSDSEAIA